MSLTTELHRVINEFHCLNLFKKRIRIRGIIKFTYPENSIKIFVANVGDVVCVPDGHVNISWFISIKFKI